MGAGHHPIFQGNDTLRSEQRWRKRPGSQHETLPHGNATSMRRSNQLFRDGTYAFRISAVEGVLGVMQKGTLRCKVAMALFTRSEIYSGSAWFPKAYFR